MNINAQDLMLINKNMRFGETKPSSQPASPVTEPPVTKPESGLSALEAQAQNNINFQGGASKAAQSVLAKLRNKSATYLLAGMMAVAAPAMMTSCSESYSYSYVNMDEFFKYMQQQNDKLDAILEELKLSRQVQEESLAIQKENQAILMQMYETQQLTYQEVQNISNTLTTGIADITSYLKAQGATDAEILEAIKGFRADVNEWAQKFANKQASLEEYLAGIQASIDEAKQILQDILATVKGISEQMTNNHNEYMAAREEEIEMLGKLYFQGKIDQSYLEDLFQNSNKMLEFLASINKNTEDLKNIFTNEENYNKFMADLAEMMPEDIDYAKFEAMFNMLGLTIEDVMNMSRKDILGAINEFQNNYLANESKQAEILDQINGKLDVLKQLPGLNLAGIQEAIDKLTEAYLNGNEDVTMYLEKLVAQMNDVIVRLDNVIDNTSGLTEFFADQKANWANALGNMEKGNQILDQIRQEQKVTNEKLDAFKGEFGEMKEAQKLSNSYLQILVGKAGDLEEAINGLDVSGGSGMTRDEFISAMEEVDARRAEEFKKFIEEYGFDKVPGDVQTIKELLADVKDAINNQGDVSGKLDRVIALEEAIYLFLSTADFTDPAVLEKLDTIIEKMQNIKCECECGNNGGSSDESVEDLEDIFGQN